MEAFGSFILSEGLLDFPPPCKKIWQMEAIGSFMLPTPELPQTPLARWGVRTDLGGYPGPLGQVPGTPGTQSFPSGASFLAFFDNFFAKKSARNAFLAALGVFFFGKDHTTV